MIWREKAKLGHEQETAQNRLRGLIDEARVLEVRLMTALYYFGLAGLPEDLRALKLRQREPERYRRQFAVFVRLVDDYLVTLSTIYATGFREYASDPPDLVYLIYIWSDDASLDNWREGL